MLEFASAMAKNVKPYTPGEQPKDQQYIKINTNENPYGPSPKVTEAVQLLLKTPETLRLYPDSDTTELRKEIAAHNGLEAEEVFIGNGSDEVLGFSFMAFADAALPMNAPAISYSFYPVWADFLSIPLNTVPMQEDLSIRMEDFIDKTGPVIIANPNAPTALALKRSEIEVFLRKCPDRLLIVDEAYVDFGAESMVPLIHTYPNLLVVQTFSKSRSLAGGRIGFAMGQKDLIDTLNRVKNSFNSYTLNSLSLAAALAAYKDYDYFEMTRKKIIATRDRVLNGLREHHFTVTDSKTNFLWVKHDTISGQMLYGQLRKAGILVRHFSAPEITDYIRVSIGTDADMDCFLTKIYEIAGEKNA